MAAKRPCLANPTSSKAVQPGFRLPQELLSVAFDYVGFKEVFECARLVCKAWSQRMSYKYVEWDIDACPYEVMTKMVNPSSVRVVKFSGTKNYGKSMLNFFSHARLLCISYPHVCDLSQTTFTHLFQDDNVLHIYPLCLMYLFTEIVAVEFENLLLPNLTELHGRWFPLYFFPQKDCTTQMPVYKDDPSVDDIGILNSLPKTYRVEITTKYRTSLDLVLHLSHTDNLYFSLTKLCIQTTVSADQWKDVATLPNLASLDLLCHLSTVDKAIYTTKFAWPSLKHVTFGGGYLNYLAMFFEAAHLISLGFEDDPCFECDKKIGFSHPLHIQRLNVNDCNWTVFGDLRDLVTFDEVKGSVSGPSDMLDTVVLPDTVRRVDLLHDDDMLADTIVGFMSRHFFTDVTLRAQGFYMKNPTKIRWLVGFKRLLRLGARHTLEHLSDECRFELERVATLFIHNNDSPVHFEEDAFNQFIRENSHLINNF